MFSLFSEEINVMVTSINIGNKKALPEHYLLHQNYPNPFNSNTTLYFEVPKLSEIRINIFNLNGQMVADIFKGLKEPGYHSMNWRAENISKIYLGVKIVFHFRYS